MGLDTGLNLKSTNSESMYWRKANAIHNWFVENVQDGVDECNEYDVSVEKLKELLNICNDVLEDNDLAETLLPTQGGFFFGTTDYDEWYFENVAKTAVFLTNTIAEYDDKEVFVYWSSW